MTEHKTGYAAILGLPNSGKSTLLNALLGQKLSIITSKPQTTRKRILGILSEENYQIICQESRKKMPVFNCSCGIKILIVPDLPAMNKALKKHQIEHKELTGKDIDEEILSHGILQAIINSLSTPN